jgi:hypothetical protein
MDLEKLTPLPWEAGVGDNQTIWMTRHGLRCVLGDVAHGSQADADFIALARNAFDIMMMRGWSPERMGDTWIVNDEDGRWFGYPHPYDPLMRWPDPFTALVEADAWFKANIEKKHDVG